MSRISFPRELCANCSNKDKCKPKIYKKVAQLIISVKGKEGALQLRRINSEEFKDYSRLRNGIETVPSNLRQNYNLDKLPRGLKRGRFFFGFKIMALNFRNSSIMSKVRGIMPVTHCLLHKKQKEKQKGTQERIKHIELPYANYKF